MKKVYISVPMRDRQKEDIEYSLRKMRKIARAYLADSKEEEDNIEFISTIVQEKSPEGVDEKVWYLGAALQNMSKADYLVCVDESWRYNGCATERDVFERYKGPQCVIKVPFMSILSDRELEELKECECSECEE